MALLVVILAGTMGLSGPLSAEASSRESGSARGEEFSESDLVALERFLTMSDEELARLEAALARIRAMTEEERRQFAERVLEYRQLPQEERRRTREGWGRQDEVHREDWRRMMRDLTPAERREVHESLQDLSPQERVKQRLKLIEEWRESSVP